MYVERRRTDLETDFSESLSTLKEKHLQNLDDMYWSVFPFQLWNGEKSVLLS